MIHLFHAHGIRGDSGRDDLEDVHRRVRVPDVLASWSELPSYGVYTARWRARDRIHRVSDAGASESGLRLRRGVHEVTGVRDVRRELVGMVLREARDVRELRHHRIRNIASRAQHRADDFSGILRGLKLVVERGKHVHRERSGLVIEAGFHQGMAVRVAHQFATAVSQAGLQPVTCGARKIRC